MWDDFLSTCLGALWGCIVAAPFYYWVDGLKLWYLAAVYCCSVPLAFVLYEIVKLIPVRKNDGRVTRTI